MGVMGVAMIKLNEGDIYRWSWNDKTLKNKAIEIQAGTLYWCCSRIGVVKDGFLIDTYWGAGSQYDKVFNASECEEKLTLQLIANFSDLKSAQPTDRAYYLDNDCIDLNHSNSSRGNFYIRKDAVKSIDKMRLILNRKKLNLERKLKQIAREIELAEKDISGLTIESYINCDSEVSLNDSSYQDDQL